MAIAPSVETPAQKPTTTPNAPPSARNKAAILAELEAGDVGTTPPKPSEKKVVAPAESDDGGDDGAELEAKGEDDGEGADPAPEVADDAETTKGLDRIKAAEKRMRIELAKEREVFEREREQHKSESKTLQQKVDAFEKLIARAKYDPVSVLRILGVSDDDLVDVSRMVYAGSPEFLKDPKNKEQAARFAREKEESDRLRHLTERQERLETELKQEREAAKAEAAIGAYMDGVVKAVNEETPLVHRMLTKSPAQVRSDLRQIAEVMAQEGGEISERSVVSMLERVMREEAEEEGWDVSTFAKAKPKAVEGDKKPAGKPAAPAAKPAANGARAGRAARADMLAQLESGNLE